jgi:hypothetical protein
MPGKFGNGRPGILIEAVSITLPPSFSMFAIMNISDIPAVYLTAQVALISVVFLYLTIVFCYPAYCWLDFRRQADGRYDILVCKKAKSERTEPKADQWSRLIYTKLYKPLMLGSPKVRVVSHSFVWIAAATLFGFGAYGLTQSEIGLGLEVRRNTMHLCDESVSRFTMSQLLSFLFRTFSRLPTKHIVGPRFALKNWHLGRFK